MQFIFVSLQEQVCNFKYECPYGEDEASCPIFTAFGDCAGNLTKCYWREEQAEDDLNWRAFKGNVIRLT